MLPEVRAKGALVLYMYYIYGRNFDGTISCDNVEEREYPVNSWIWPERFAGRM